MKIDEMLERAEKILREMEECAENQELDLLRDILDEGARCLKIEEAITEYYRNKITYAEYADNPVVTPIRLISLCLGDIDLAMSRKNFYCSQLCNDINRECNLYTIPKLRKIFVNAEDYIKQIVYDSEKRFHIYLDNVADEANVYGYIYSCILDTGSSKPVYAICDSLKCAIMYGGRITEYNKREDFKDSVISICEDLLDKLLDMSKQRLYEIEKGVEH